MSKPKKETPKPEIKIKDLKPVRSPKGGMRVPVV
jgi:hypothetical protein